MASSLFLPQQSEKLDWSYFVEWHPWLWSGAVRWLIGDPGRFAGKRVLELGCRYGRMSCLFGLLGAEVVGVELGDTTLRPARAEAKRWQVEDRVQFIRYGGDPTEIPGPPFDFIFTKSVLVVVPELEVFLGRLASKLNPGGELLAAENMAGGPALNLARRIIIHRSWRSSFERKFTGVDAAFVDRFSTAFEVAEMRRYYGLVAAIRARPRPEAAAVGAGERL